MATVDDITQQALNLDLEERAKLAERLLESLDGLTQAEVEKLWLDEAERRVQEYRSGHMGAVSADQVLREAEDLLR